MASSQPIKRTVPRKSGKANLIDGSRKFDLKPHRATLDIRVLSQNISVRTCTSAQYSAILGIMRTCVSCGAEMLISTSNRSHEAKKYCSKACHSTYLRGGEKILGNLSAGTVGALGELVVSADLMRRGYEVYRALSPASSCDVLALKDGQMFSIEVRTGWKSLGGRLTTNKVNLKAQYLAIVIHREGEVIYQPDLPK